MRLSFILLFMALWPQPNAAAQFTATGDSTVILSLEEAGRIALDLALPLRISAQDLAVAGAAAQSTSAIFDPNLGLSSSFSRADVGVGSQNGVNSSVTDGRTLNGTLTGVLPTSTQYSVVALGQPSSSSSTSGLYDNTLSFALTQPLLRGFGTLGGLEQTRAADVGYDAARARYSRQRELLLANVETLYLLLAQREDEELAARQSLARAETLFVANEELVRLGRITNLDFLATRSGVAQRRNALVTAARARLDSADQLVNYIYGEQAPARLADLAPRVRTAPLDVEVPTVEDQERAADLAVTRRTDVQAARLEVDRSQRLLRIARNGLLPDLGLNLSYTALGDNSGFFQFNNNAPGVYTSQGWQTGLSFNFPLPNRRSRGAYNQARALATQSRLAETSAENAARTDARAAVRAIVAGRESLAEAEQGFDVATQHYQGEVERNRLGLSDSFRVLQVEEDVASAELALIRARFGLLSAATQYKLAIGQEYSEEYSVTGTP